MSEDDVKTMNAIKQAVSEGKDVEVRADKGGGLKLIASSKKTITIK